MIDRFALLKLKQHLEYYGYPLVDNITLFTNKQYIQPQYSKMILGINSQFNINIFKDECSVDVVLLYDKYCILVEMRAKNKDRERAMNKMLKACRNINENIRTSRNIICVFGHGNTDINYEFYNCSGMRLNIDFVKIKMAMMNNINIDKINECNVKPYSVNGIQYFCFEESNGDILMN